MRKEHFSVPLDKSIVEKFNDDELVMIHGGNAVRIILTILDILTDGGGNGVCDNNISCTNTGNCVQGCACTST